MKTTLMKLYLDLRRWARTVLARSPGTKQLAVRLLRPFERLFASRQDMDQHYRDIAATRDHISVHGYDLYYRQDRPDRLVCVILWSGQWEPETREIVSETLEPGMTFVDIGAHLGYFSLLAASRVGPTGHVYSFEPAPPSRELLLKSIARNNLGQIITVIPGAVKEAPGQISFILEDDALLNRIADSGPGPGRITVEAFSLDSYFSGLGFPRVDLIKVDVEGHELDVFRGMTELNRRNPGLKLVFEYGVTADGAAILAELGRLGFNRFHLLHEGRLQLNIPEQIPLLNELAERHAYVNVMAEKV